MSNSNVPLAKGWQIMNFETTRTVTASIQHWQLRHLLKPSQGLCESKDQEHSVIYVHEKKLFTVTIKHGSTLLPREVASLDFAPFCLAFAHGFIAVGGDGGLVSILQVVPHTFSTEIIWTGRVGRFPVNSVEISQSLSGNIYLIVSTNDKEVKVFGLPYMVVEFSHTFPVSMNFASLNPSGDSLVAVGDSLDVYLYSLRDRQLQERAVFRDADDFGFSCSWHPNNYSFAVGSQDGLVNVWDIRKASESSRSGQTIAKFKSFQTTQNSKAIRSVQFSSSNSIELLVFAEQSSYVNVVDARNYEDRQIIKLGSLVLERRQFQRLNGDIAGLTFSPSCNYLYISMPNAIYKYKTDVIARRSFPSFGYH